MTLDEYCNMTEIEPMRLMFVYEYKDYDDVCDRIDQGKEYKLEAIDEYAIFSVPTTQTYTLKWFVRDRFSEAKVEKQIIHDDRIYVFIEYDNDGLTPS